MFSKFDYFWNSVSYSVECLLIFCFIYKNLFFLLDSDPWKIVWKMPFLLLLFILLTLYVLCPQVHFSDVSYCPLFFANFIFSFLFSFVKRWEGRGGGGLSDNTKLKSSLRNILFSVIFLQLISVYVWC